MVKCSNCGRHIRKNQTDIGTYRKMLDTKHVERSRKTFPPTTTVTRRCPFCGKR
jgi:hypothetical protein